MVSMHGLILRHRKLLLAVIKLSSFCYWQNSISDVNLFYYWIVQKVHTQKTTHIIKFGFNIHHSTYAKRISHLSTAQDPWKCFYTTLIIVFRFDFHFRYINIGSLSCLNFISRLNCHFYVRSFAERQ